MFLPLYIHFVCSQSNANYNSLNLPHIYSTIKYMNHLACPETHSEILKWKHVFLGTREIHLTENYCLCFHLMSSESNAVYYSLILMKHPHIYGVLTYISYLSFTETSNLLLKWKHVFFRTRGICLPKN